MFTIRVSAVRRNGRAVVPGIKADDVSQDRIVDTSNGLISCNDGNETASPYRPFPLSFRVPVYVALFVV